jgi:hypothetical protein
VPYKFAPPMLRRSASNQSSNSEKLKLSIPNPKPEDPADGSDCDYVTLTYNENDLVAVDGEEVKRTTNSTPSTPPSAGAARINHEIMMMSTSDTNINYCKPLVEVPTNLSEESEMFPLNSSINDLERSGKHHKSLLQRFMGLRITESHNDETLSQKSVSTSASRKSLDSGVLKSYFSYNSDRKLSMTEIAQNSGSIPPIYRQGSEDLGSRIAHVDYADPKTLFPSTSNILINKAALKSQRDSVFSSSSDSVCDPQIKQIQMEDSYYEQCVEDCLENDFRDSAVYSDDNNGRLDALLTPEFQHEEHIYAQVNKKTKTPPIVPKKPSLLVKPLPITTPPPVPVKPSNLKSPDVKKVILSYRNSNSSTSSNLPINTSRLSSGSNQSTNTLTPEVSNESTSPKSWVLQQVQKFQ